MVFLAELFPLVSPAKYQEEIQSKSHILGNILVSEFFRYKN